MASPVLACDLPFLTAPPEPLVVLTLPIRPKAKSRPRFNLQSGHAHPTHEDEAWCKLAVGHARLLLPHGLTYDMPLRLDILAVFARTKDQEKDRSLPDGLLWYPQGGDRDALAGSVMDALGSPTARAKRGKCLWGDRGLWRDDTLIVVGETIKARAERGGPERVVISVSEAWAPALILGRLASAR